MTNKQPTIEMIPVKYWKAMYSELTEHFNAQRAETETNKERRYRIVEQIRQLNEELEDVDVLIAAEIEVKFVPKVKSLIKRK